MTEQQQPPTVPVEVDIVEDHTSVLEVPEPEQTPQPLVDDDAFDDDGQPIPYVLADPTATDVED